MTEEEFWKILLDVPESNPVFYRAYYNEQGWVETYTMEDLPGNYIEVEQSIYALSPRAQVINGKLHVVRPASLTNKLVPSNTGTACHAQDICIIDTQEPNIKWSIKYYESN